MDTFFFVFNNMVYLLIRVTVVNSEQFLDTYHKLKSIRKEAGCTKLFCFSKKNYPEVVTLIAEWPSRSSYDDFRYRTEDDYKNLFRPEFTEIHELDCIFQQTIIPEYNKKQISPTTGRSVSLRTQKTAGSSARDRC